MVSGKKRNGLYDGNPGFWLLHPLPHLLSCKADGAAAHPLPSSPLQPLLLQVFLGLRLLQEENCLHDSHTCSCCSWEGLRGGFIPKRVMCLQGEATAWKSSRSGWMGLWAT